MFDESLIKIPEFSEVPVLEPVKIQYNSWCDGLLVRSPNWLGDAVMTFPALKQLRAMLPETSGLFAVCPRGMFDLYDSLDVVDEVIPLDDAHSFPCSSEYRHMRECHAGAGILFNNSFRDALAFRRAGVRRLFGASARFRSLLLEKAWAFAPRRDHELNTPHQAMKYLAMAYALGAPEWDGVMPELDPKTGPEVFCDDLKRAVEAEDLLALAPGAAYGLAKCWDGANFRRVAEDWIKRGGSVAALGGKAEAVPCAEAVSGLDKGRVFNLSGKTTLAALIYLLKRSRACIANDSGVMHLAAACGIPGVAPFGSTDPAATAPLSHKWRILFRKTECSPCFKRICPFGDKHCFAPISPDDVINALQEAVSC